MKTVGVICVVVGALSSAGAWNNYFWNHFDTDPPLGPFQNTETTTVWGWDRYRPTFFDSQPLGGDNRLRIGIRDEARWPNRSAGFQSEFYNTQGRKLDVGTGLHTSIRGKLFIGSDWATERRRSDLWGVGVDASNVISAYAILGATTNNPAAPYDPNPANLVTRFRVWNDDLGFWIDLPTPIVYDTWYELEIRLLPERIEFYIDGTLVYTDTQTYATVKWDEMILQAFSFENPLVNPTWTADEYDVYWDDVNVMPSASNARVPVDLNGKYFAASAQTFPGLSFALTVADPLYGKVVERSRDGSPNPWDPNAVEGTYTPFSDATKPPSTFIAARNGLGFQGDVSVSGNWAAFSEGFGIAAVDANMSLGARIYWDGNSYVVTLGARLTGAPFTLEQGGTPYDSPPGTTMFRIELGLDNAGNIAGAVTPLNGPDANTQFGLGTFSPTIGTLGSPVAFSAGFITDGVVHAKGNATLTNMMANAPANALYAHVANPYVKPSTPSAFSYSVGMANLAQPVVGFQAFGNAVGSPTLVDLGGISPYYTATPFSNHLGDPRGILTPASLASGVPLPGSGVTVDAILANLPYSTVAGEGIAWLAILATNGSGIPTRFSDGSGNPVIPNRIDSNIVVIDGTPPTVSLISATQGANDILVTPAMLGNAVFEVNAADTGAFPSGLSRRPRIILNFSPIGNSGTGPEDVELDVYSWTANRFRGEHVFTPTTPCGPAEIIAIADDDSGNQTVSTTPFNVNIATVTVTVTLQGVTTNVNRWIQFVVGGTGGTNPPIVIDRVVSFVGGTATVVFDAMDGIPCDPNLTHISAKNPLHTLRKKVALTGVNNQFTAPAITLIGGDANNDNLVDILDFGLLVANFGTTPGANTSIGQPPPHLDFSGDGVVGTADYTFIQINFLQVGDTPPGNFLFERQTPRKSATVKEMIQAGVKHAEKYDLDGDGWITYDELVRVLFGR